MAANEMATKVEAVEAIIGYHFEDPLILWEALQAAGSGVQSAGTRRFAEGNKRLAVLGDAILGVALMDDWYATNESRGRGTEVMQTVPVNANLDRMARRHGLDVLVCRNRAQGRIISVGVVTATVQAIIAAVFLDSNLGSVKTVMITLGLVPT